jgi:alkaline phosphatase D
MGWRRRPEHVESAKHRRVKTLFIQVVSVFAQVMAGGLVLAQVLTHGPVVGGVTSSKARVFLRTDQESSVALCYGADPNLDTCQMSATYPTRSAHDFTKIIRLSGLMPGTTFYLNILVNGVPQLTSPPYPSFKTFPTAGSLRNFNFVVLTDFVPPFNLTRAVQTYASAAAEHPAFVFIGGDFDHRNPRTLSAKRRMFKDLYDANTPYMADFVNLILQQTPIIHQWDDHDAGLNNCDKTYPDWNLTQEVFEEYVPGYPLPSVTPGIWQKFSYAQADFFVLDCRSQRDPDIDPDNVNKSMLDGNDLGTAGQLQWLEDGLLRSTARWKIIFTSVVINPTTRCPDGWCGFQTEWHSLKNFINTNNIQGVVFISGDLHIGGIDNGINAGFPELCVIQANGGAQDVSHCPTGPIGHWSEGYYIGNCTGYGLVKILQNPDRLLLQVKGEYGNRQISYTVTQ